MRGDEKWDREPPCADGREHRWFGICGLGWLRSTPVEVCDCGLLRVGTDVTQERDGGKQYDWNYYRMLTGGKYHKYEKARHMRAFA